VNKAYELKKLQASFGELGKINPMTSSNKSMLNAQSNIYVEESPSNTKKSDTILLPKVPIHKPSKKPVLKIVNPDYRRNSHL
jgi:hypothetical protein